MFGIIDNMIRITVDTAISQNHLSNPKPLEDYLITDNESKIFIILDGVSIKVNGIYLNPSPSFEVTRIFAEQVLSTLKRTELPSDVKYWLKQAVVDGNKRIKDSNDQKKWNYLPGTVGIISVISDNKFYYVSVGDCSGRILHKGKVKLLTYSQTELIERHKAEFSVSEIRNNICNNKNHPYGYGVFTGEQRVIDFLQFGVVTVYKGDMILLATDGLDPLINSEKFQMNNLISAKELIIEAEELEEDRKASKSDDKAIIIIRVE